MRNYFNKTQKIINFPLDELSIETIEETPRTDKNRIIDKEKDIEEAVRNTFPFDKEKKENDIESESSEIKASKSVVFKTLTLNRKRGRKSKNSSNNKKKHSAKDLDNNIRKIQTHFLNTFIIFILNDIAFSINHNKKPMFKKFDHSEIKNINFESVKELKRLKIRNLFSKFNISPKYKTISLEENKNFNEQNLDKLSKYSGFNEFINQNYLKVFNLYYNNRKPLKTILIGGKEISLSKKTKNFSCLLKNNKQYEKELLQTAELVYLNQNILNVSSVMEEQQ